MIKFKIRMLDDDRVEANLKEKNSTAEEYLCAIKHLIIVARKNNVSNEVINRIVKGALKEDIGV